MEQGFSGKRTAEVVGKRPEAEREQLQFLARPSCASVEIWRFPDRCHAPIIERL